MANIALHIEDEANRMTLRAMLERAGHRVVDLDGDAAITDRPARAAALCGQKPTLVLAPLSGVAEAVAAMRQGVHGYILLPFQPGEAELMVERALARGAAVASTQAEQPPRPLEEVEMEYIIATLKRCGNNQAQAARLLGIGRNTLWRKLKKVQDTGEPQRAQSAGN